MGRDFFHPRWLLPLGLILANISTQVPAASIVSVSLEKRNVSVTFDTGLETQDKETALDPNKYLLINSKRKTFRFERVRIVQPADPNFLPSQIWLQLPEGPPIDLTGPDAPYFLFVFGLTFDGKAEDVMQHLVGSGPTPSEPRRAVYEYAPGESRDDSSVYFAGEINGASGSGPFFSIDLKAERPTLRNFWDRVHTFAPFFDLKASSSPKADPDSMKFGGRWSFPVWSPETGGDLSGILWKNFAQIEAQRDFDTANAIWETRLDFAFSPFASLPQGMDLKIGPFIGMELGRNLESPVMGFDEKVVARPYSGAVLYFKAKRLRFDASYIRRWPLRNEIIIKTENKKERAVSIGKGPREYVDAKLTFKLSEFWGAFAGYEYGELPPAFDPVDHRFSIGFVYQLAIKPPQPE